MEILDDFKKKYSIYEITDYKKLKGYFEEHKIIQEKFCKKVGIDRKTLRDILNGKSIPNQATIKKIVSGINVPVEDIGIIISKEYTTSSINFNEALEKKHLKFDELIEILKKEATNNNGLYIVDNAILKWYKGENPPNEKIVKLISDILDVDSFYLLGKLKYPKLEDSLIFDELNLDKETISSIKELIDLHLYGKETHQALEEEYGISYSNIVNFIIKNIDFLHTFFLEAVRTTEYEYSDITKNTYRNNFDDFLNTTEISVDYFNSIDEKEKKFDTTITHSTLNQITQRDISLLILKSQLEKIFDKYVEQMKLNKKQFDEKNVSNKK